MGAPPKSSSETDILKLKEFYTVGSLYITSCEETFYCYPNFISTVTCHKGTVLLLSKFETNVTNTEDISEIVFLYKNMQISPNVLVFLGIHYAEMLLTKISSNETLTP